MSERRTKEGWEIRIHPGDNTLLINIPHASGLTGPEQLTRTCACPACRRRPDIAGVAAMMTPQLLQALDALASWRQEQRRGPPAGCSAEEPAGNRLVLAPASQLQPVPDPTAQAGAACSTMR